MAGKLVAESSESRKPIIREICPRPIGIEIPGDEMDVFIAKGVKLPYDETKRYMTIADNQTAFRIVVREGDSEKASENKIVGYEKLRQIPEDLKETRTCIVRMQMNQSNSVTVEAWEEDKVDNKITM